MLMPLARPKTLSSEVKACSDSGDRAKGVLALKLKSKTAGELTKKLTKRKLHVLDHQH